MGITLIVLIMVATLSFSPWRDSRNKDLNLCDQSIFYNFYNDDGKMIDEKSFPMNYPS